jgi:predicted DNA-binding ribbon-helix-helix protein
MLKKRSFSLSGHRTSIALEAEFWAVLRRLAAAEQCSLSMFVARVDAAREPERKLASALRVAVLAALDNNR